MFIPSPSQNWSGIQDTLHNKSKKHINRTSTVCSHARQCFRLSMYANFHWTLTFLDRTYHGYQNSKTIKRTMQSTICIMDSKIEKNITSSTLPRPFALITYSYSSVFEQFKSSKYGIKIKPRHISKAKISQEMSTSSPFYD